MELTGNPSVDMLGSAAGLAGVVWIVTAVLRQSIGEAAFDRWGALVACAVGVALGLAYVVATVSPVDARALLGGVLVGLTGGWLSQNLNTVVTRARAK